MKSIRIGDCQPDDLSITLARLWANFNEEINVVAETVHSTRKV